MSERILIRTMNCGTLFPCVESPPQPRRIPIRPRPSKTPPDPALMEKYCRGVKDGKGLPADMTLREFQAFVGGLTAGYKAAHGLPSDISEIVAVERLLTQDQDDI